MCCDVLPRRPGRHDVPVLLGVRGARARRSARRGARRPRPPVGHGPCRRRAPPAGLARPHPPVHLPLASGRVRDHAARRDRPHRSSSVRRAGGRAVRRSPRPPDPRFARSRRSRSRSGRRRRRPAVSLWADRLPRGGSGASHVRALAPDRGGRALSGRPCPAQRAERATCALWPSTAAGVDGQAGLARPSERSEPPTRRAGTPSQSGWAETEPLARWPIRTLGHRRPRVLTHSARSTRPAGGRDDPRW